MKSGWFGDYMRLLLNDNITVKRANCTCYSLISWLFGLTASRHAGQRFSITPYITPRRTPTGTPNIISTSVSPKGYSAAGSPQRTSGATSPTKPQYDKQASLSSWYPSSQQSSAANSPPRGRAIPGLWESLQSLMMSKKFCISDKSILELAKNIVFCCYWLA
jgi:hypothetical protein